MNGPSTTSPVVNRPATTSLRSTFAVVTLAIVAAAGLWGLSRLLAGPGRVDRISFENPTVFDIGVDASGSGRGGQVALGIARRGTTTTFQEVLDQGDDWVFRFSAQGTEGGELTITRAALERTDWTVEIPEGVGEDLRARGALPPP